jgi:hypothetical protein
MGLLGALHRYPDIAGRLCYTYSQDQKFDPATAPGFFISVRGFIRDRARARDERG